MARTFTSLAGPVPLLGRTQELRAIEGMMNAVEAGLGGMVAFCGEGGIGKTRLAEEVTARAVARGWSTAWGSGWPDGGAPPMWPWQEILSQLELPRAVQLLDDHGAAGELEPERFTRFRAVTSAVGEIANEGPVLMVLDDVHATDPGAQLLARLVIRSLRAVPALLVVTCRPMVDVPVDVREGLVNLLDEGTTVEVGGLDLDALVSLLDWAGAGAAQTRATELLELSGGNPLLALELVTHVGPAASTSVRTSVGRAGRFLSSRLDTLTADERTVLAAGALLGPGIDDRLVASVASVTRDVTEQDARAARQRGVEVGVLRRGGDGFVFSHGLLRDALLDSVSGDRLTLLHSRAADALEATRTPASIDRLTRVAHHRLAAANAAVVPDSGAVTAAVEATRVAARAISHRFAYEAAAELLDSAQRLHARTNHPAPAGLLLELAQMQLAGGHLTQARATFAQALHTADAEADPDVYAEAAIGLGGIWVFEHREPDAVAAFHGALRSALTHVSGARPDLAIRIRARLGAEELYMGTSGLDRVLEAVDEARSLGDPTALAEVLSLLHHTILGPDFVDERTPVASELIAIASANGDAVLTLMGVLWRTVDEFLLGAPTAERALTELRQRADGLGVRAVLYVVALIDVMLLMRAGRLDEAEAAAVRCVNVGMEVGDADAPAYFGAQLLAMRWLQGRTGEILPMAREVAASPTIISIDRAYPASVAALAANTGPAHYEEARRELDKLLKEGLDTIPPSSTWLLTMFAVVEAAARLEEPESAAVVYELTSPFAGLPTMASLAVVCFGSTERTLGLAARTIGRLDTAIGHLERAVEADRQLGNRPMLAITRADLGLTLLRRGAPGDRARAQELLSSAIEALDTMGLSGRVAMVEADVAAIDERSSPSIRSLRYSDGAWEVQAEGERVVVPDSAGMRHLARLLASPNEDIPAAELAGTGIETSRQEVLDREALVRYGHRIEALRREVDDAEADADIERAARLGVELDQLVEHVEASMGLAGKSRTFVDTSERARTAVQKAIRRAIDRIKLPAPNLGDMLARCVRTGTSCRYVPDESDDDGAAWLIVGPNGSTS
jgi:tetratricopeptide (TPR) repeat protein